MAGRDQLVQGSHPVTDADLARILRVIAERLVRQGPVLVADQPVGPHPGRVELDLDLDVIGQGEQGAAHLPDQHPVGLEQAVDVGVVAVALVGQQFHGIIAVIAPAEAEHTQVDAMPALLFDQLLQFVPAGHADVEIAVRGEDDPVGGPGQETLPGQLVGGADAAGAMGRTARLQAVDGGEDTLLLVAGGGRQHHPVRAGVHHQGHPVAFAQLPHQERQGLLQERQLVRVPHRAGDIDEEDQVRGRQFFPGEIACREADAHQPVVAVEGAGAHLGAQGERFAALRPGIVIGKGIDHLLDAHRARGRQAAVLDKAADIGVAGGVDIDAEGGQGIAGRVDETGFLPGVVGFPVPGRRCHHGQQGRTGGLQVGCGAVDQGFGPGFPGRCAPARDGTGRGGGQGFPGHPRLCRRRLPGRFQGVAGILNRSGPCFLVLRFRPG